MAHSPTHLSQNVSRETFSHLEGYVGLLLKWNAKINLIGPTTESDVWSRHVEDALQLLPLLPPTATSLADLGSGAGLPGMILAIARPDIAVTLVEIDQRKSAFLQEVKRALALDHVTIEAKDLHTLTARFDVVTARALAPLKELLAMAYPLLQPGAICLFPKGENFANELAATGNDWSYQHQLFPSLTNKKSSIISITELSKTHTV
ncbi:MAG: 16S rRNA (guanine(527)-N(7))-methyltransferase RsmG [Pseudomonadota bacterium]